MIKNWHAIWVIDKSVNSSVTSLGDFWKFLAKNFLTKVAKTFGDIRENFEKHEFWSQPVVATFWEFEKFGLLNIQHLVALANSDNLVKQNI